MPGPINLNPDVIEPPTDIAWQDAAGNWRAGEAAKGYSPGQFVPSDYATKARKVRQNANMVKSIMRANDEPEDKARERVHKIREAMAEAENEAERREAWQSHGYGEAAA